MYGLKPSFTNKIIKVLEDSIREFIFLWVGKALPKSRESKRKTRSCELARMFREGIKFEVGGEEHILHIFVLFESCTITLT